MTNETVPDAALDAWESGELGADEKHAERASPELEAEVEDALELQMISIRLQKALLKELKLIADYYGVGYQPLMRDILGRWARTELSVIAHEMKRKIKDQEQVEAARQQKVAAG